MSATDSFASNTLSRTYFHDPRASLTQANSARRFRYFSVHIFSIEVLRSCSIEVDHLIALIISLSLYLNIR